MIRFIFAVWVTLIFVVTNLFAQGNSDSEVCYDKLFEDYIDYVGDTSINEMGMYVIASVSDQNSKHVFLSVYMSDVKFTKLLLPYEVFEVNGVLCVVQDISFGRGARAPVDSSYVIDKLSAHGYFGETEDEWVSKNIHWSPELEWGVKLKKNSTKCNYRRLKKKYPKYKHKPLTDEEKEELEDLFR